MDIYYDSYSNTSGEKYLIGYGEGNPNTGNVIVIKINDKED